MLFVEAARSFRLLCDHVPLPLAVHSHRIASPLPNSLTRHHATQEGSTAEDLARGEGHDDIVALLTEK